MNAGCNLELSYGMRNNVFMHIPQALVMGNITLQVSWGSGAGGAGRELGLPPPSAAEVLVLASSQMLRDRVRPLFYTRMRLGEFDPPAMNPYSTLNLSAVQSPEHRNLSLEAAVKSFVLLKNARGMLPLRAQDLPGKRLAVSTARGGGQGDAVTQGLLAPYPGHPGVPSSESHRLCGRGWRCPPSPLCPPQVVGPFADNPRVLFGDYAPVPEPRYIYTPR